MIRYLVNQDLGKCYQPRLIMITKTLIILDITEPEFGNIYCLIIHYLIATIHCHIEHNFINFETHVIQFSARVH